MAGDRERGSLKRLCHQPTVVFLPPLLKKKGEARMGRGGGAGQGRRGGVSARGQLHLSTHILHSISHQSGQYGCRRKSARPPTFLILIPKKLICCRPFSFSDVSLLLTSGSAQRDASLKSIWACASFLLSSSFV